MENSESRILSDETIETFTDADVANIEGNPAILDSLIPLFRALSAADSDPDREMDVGRGINLSSHFREDITQSVFKLTMKMPSDDDIMIAIRKCMYLLRLADLSKANDQSHLLRLPRELRDRIFTFTLDTGHKYLQLNRCYLQTESDQFEDPESMGDLPAYCDSSSSWHKFCRHPKKWVRIMPALLLVSKQVSFEATMAFYRHNSFAVTCTCKLYELLSRSAVRQSIRSVRFGLFGSERLKAISLLGQCKLENLTITIGMKSTNVVSLRERQFRQSGLHRIERATRLGDASGVLQLKGFGVKKGITVDVERFRSERNERERAGLHQFINN